MKPSPTSFPHYYHHPSPSGFSLCYDPDTSNSRYQVPTHSQPCPPEFWLPPASLLCLPSCSSVSLGVPHPPALSFPDYSPDQCPRPSASSKRQHPPSPHSSFRHLLPSYCSPILPCPLWGACTLLRIFGSSSQTVNQIYPGLGNWATALEASTSTEV